MMDNQNMEVVTKLVILLLIGFSQPVVVTEAFHVSLSHQNGKLHVNLPGAPGVTLPRGDLSTTGFVPSRSSNPSNSLISTADKIKDFVDKDHHNRDIANFAKQVLSSIAERTSYANSEEEMKQWKEDAYLMGRMGKRSGQNEQHNGGCTAEKDWIELTPNHYPRFIKSYKCNSQNCDRNGSCRPKRYSVKVLMRKSSENSALQNEECDQTLPEELRCGWKLDPVNVTTYCECVPSGFPALGR